MLLGMAAKAHQQHLNGLFPCSFLCCFHPYCSPLTPRALSSGAISLQTGIMTGALLGMQQITTAVGGKLAQWLWRQSAKGLQNSVWK
jgi:hypothetical protein